MTDDKIPFADHVIQLLKSGKYKHVCGYFADNPDYYTEANRLVHREGWAGDPTERDSWNLFVNVGWFKSATLHRGPLRTQIKLTKAQKQAFYEIEKMRLSKRVDREALARAARQKEIEEMQWWP